MFITFYKFSVTDTVTIIAEIRHRYYPEWGLSLSELNKDYGVEEIYRVKGIEIDTKVLRFIKNKPITKIREADVERWNNSVNYILEITREVEGTEKTYTYREKQRGLRLRGVLPDETVKAEKKKLNRQEIIEGLILIASTMAALLGVKHMIKTYGETMKIVGRGFFDILSYYNLNVAEWNLPEYQYTRNLWSLYKIGILLYIASIMILLIYSVAKKLKEKKAREKTYEENRKNHECKLMGGNDGGADNE